MRKTPSAPGPLCMVHTSFERLDDPVRHRGLTLTDCPMSGLAIFGLKSPSLPRCDRDAMRDERVRENLRNLYAIERIPCDTTLRERLGRGDPRAVRQAFRCVFAALQRGKGLEGLACPGGRHGDEAGHPG